MKKQQRFRTAPVHAVDDEAWPLTYRLPLEMWRQIADIAQFNYRNNRHRNRISELIAIYRLKHQWFKTQGLPKFADRNLATLQKEVAKLALTLQKPHIVSLLEVAQSSYIASTTRGDIDFAAVSRHIRALSSAVNDLKSLANRAQAPPKAGKFKEFKYPRSHNPPLLEFVEGLCHYWKKYTASRASNSVDDTRDPPVASPMTAFVRECLIVSGARDDDGNQFSLEATRKMIARLADKR